MAEFLEKLKFRQLQSARSSVSPVGAGCDLLSFCIFDISHNIETVGNQRKEEPVVTIDEQTFTQTGTVSGDKLVFTEGSESTVFTRK